MDDKLALVAAAQELARRLGRTKVSQREFARLGGAGGNASDRACRKFGGWAEFCRAAGLAANRPPQAPIPDDEIFAAMRDAFLAIGGIGTRAEFAEHFRLADSVLYRRGWLWPMALFEFRTWAERNDPGFPYMDRLPTEPPAPGAKTRRPRRPGAERVGSEPVYGEILGFRSFVRAPVNEQGVAMLFALVAADFGFAIEAVQRPFPDCEAQRSIGNGRWQRVRIEFEFLSRNFERHRHDPKGCHLIVCWEDNWGKDAPVKVLELRKAIGRLPGWR
jgi:hypothetical protein